MNEATKEEIEFCLNCKKPPYSCNFCNGLNRNSPDGRKRQCNRIPEWKEAALAEMIREGKTSREIEKALGVSKSTVWLRRRDLRNG